MKAITLFQYYILSLPVTKLFNYEEETKDNVCIVSFKKQSTSIDVAKELGKYLLDISKLVIGGAVITIALQLNDDKYGLLLYSIILALTLAVIGFIVLTYKKK